MSDREQKSHGYTAVCMCVCVCVCERERERASKRASVCVCVPYGNNVLKLIETRRIWNGLLHLCKYQKVGISKLIFLKQKGGKYKYLRKYSSLIQFSVMANRQYSGNRKK